jgi:hypothetical protein
MKRKMSASTAVKQADKVRDYQDTVSHALLGKLADMLAAASQEKLPQAHVSIFIAKAALSVLTEESWLEEPADGPYGALRVVARCVDQAEADGVHSVRKALKSIVRYARELPEHADVFEDRAAARFRKRLACVCGLDELDEESLGL